MATLREVQYTLQEKIEQVRRRDRLIDELEDELLAREREIGAMKREIRRYQNVVAKLTAINNTLRSSVKPGSTIVTSAPIIKAFENRPDFKAPKRQNAIRSSKNSETKATTPPPPAVAAVATIAATSPPSKNVATVARADEGRSTAAAPSDFAPVGQQNNTVAATPLATKDSKVAHVISLALSVQQDSAGQSRSFDDDGRGHMGRRRRGAYDGQHHRLGQQRQTKSNESPSSAPITPPDTRNGAATDSSTIFQKHKTMLPGLAALSSSSSASLLSSNESTLSINNGQLSQHQHHHSNGGLSPNGGGGGNKIFASSSSAGVIAPVLVSLAVGGETGGVSPIAGLCAVGQQQHNETVKRQISAKKTKNNKQGGGLINFAKKNT